MCNKVCEDLDDIVIDYFNTVTELYKVNDELEEKMKSGFLHMSRARYNMGVKSVGALQYNDSMLANYKVNIIPDNGQQSGDDDGLSFEKSTANESLSYESKAESGKEEMVLRKRNVTKSEEEHSSDVIGNCDDMQSEEIVTKLENIKITEHSRGQQVKDPLMWFGVLVPSSLRQSQADFRHALDIAIAQANLKRRLVSLQSKYKLLMQMKLETA